MLCWRNRLVLGWAAVLIAVGCDREPNAAQRDRVATVREAARDALRGGAPQHAIEIAEAAAKAGDGDPELLYFRGEGLRRVQRFAEAEEALTELLRQSPSHRAGSLALGIVRASTSGPEAALPLIEAYLRSAGPGDPLRAEALLEAARALRAAARPIESADRLVELLEGDPFRAELYSELAQSLYRARRREEGRFLEEAYRQFAEASAGEEAASSFARSGLKGFALAQGAWNDMKQRRFLSAFRSFKAAMAAAPSLVRIRLDLAELHLRFRRVASARALVDEALRAGARPASGLRELEARLFLEAKDSISAARAVRGAVEELEREGNQGGLDGGQAVVSSLRVLRLRAAIESGDLDAATRLFDAADSSAKEGEQERWQLSFWRGRLEMARGSMGPALERFAEAAAAGGSGNLDLLFHRALVLERLGRAAEAREELDYIREAFPSHEPIYDPLVRLEPVDSERRGKLEKARTNLRALLAKIEAIRQQADRTPIEQCGALYLELAKLGLKARDPSATDALFLAAELLPRDAEALGLLLRGTNVPRDIFVRLHLLRRLLDVASADAEALAEIAEIYLRFRVRAEEGRRIAERLHALGPTAQSHRLLGELSILARKRDEGLAILRVGGVAFPDDAALRDALKRINEP